MYGYLSEHHSSAKLKKLPANTRKSSPPKCSRRLNVTLIRPVGREKEVHCISKAKSNCMMNVMQSAVSDKRTMDNSVGAVILTAKTTDRNKSREKDKRGAQTLPLYLFSTRISRTIPCRVRRLSWIHFPHIGVDLTRLYLMRDADILFCQATRRSIALQKLAFVLRQREAHVDS